MRDEPGRLFGLAGRQLLVLLAEPLDVLLQLLSGRVRFGLQSIVIVKMSVFYSQETEQFWRSEG